MKVERVKTGNLVVHDKQNEFSPEMNTKKWKSFLKGIEEYGIKQAIVANMKGKVIDGKHRLKAAVELGIEDVLVVYEDIPENEVGTYISETKMNRDDLKSGQKAAIVIRLFYEEERARSKERMSDGGKGFPEMENLKTTHAHVELAKKAGIGKSSMANLLAVYNKRPDLFEKVFSGEYKVGRAHTEMKSDEQPIAPESPPESGDEAKQVIEKALEREADSVDFVEDEPKTSPNNRLIAARKNALSAGVGISFDSSYFKKTDNKEIKDGYKEQLRALASSCLLALCGDSDEEEEQEYLTVALELLKKSNGGD